MDRFCSQFTGVYHEKFKDRWMFPIKIFSGFVRMRKERRRRRSKSRKKREEEFKVSLFTRNESSGDLQ